MKKQLIQILVFTCILIFSHCQITSVEEDMLKVVIASPVSCKNHNKTAWMDLLTNNATIADPVGTTEHIGKEDLSKFWNTFVEPTDITFTDHFNIVSVETKQVVRFVNIRASFPESGVSTDQPAIVLYSLEQIFNPPWYNIKELKAHWQLITRVKEQVFQNYKGIWVLMKMGVKLFNNYGINGLKGYISGFIGIGDLGKTIASNLLSSWKIKDYNQFIKIMKGNLKNFEIIYHNRRETYDCSDFSFEYFWREKVLSDKFSQIEFDENTMFYSGYSTAGVMTITYKEKQFKAIFINEYENSKISRMRIWIDNIKY